MPWRLNLHDHACLFYDNWDDQNEIISSYFKEGVRRNEQCIYFADENCPDCVEESLGADPSSYSLLLADDFYFRDGHFNLKAVCSGMKRLSSAAILDGFAGLRVTVEMSWAFGRISTKTLLEYEDEVTHFCSQKPIVWICQYNVAKFSPRMIREIEKRHQFIFTGPRLTLLPFIGEEEWVEKEKQK